MSIYSQTQIKRNKEKLATNKIYFTSNKRKSKIKYSSFYSSQNVIDVYSGFPLTAVKVPNGYHDSTFGYYESTMAAKNGYHDFSPT